MTQRRQHSKCRSPFHHKSEIKMSCFTLRKQFNSSYLTITGSRSFTMVNLLIFDSPTGSAGWSARPDGPTRKSRSRNSSIHLIRNRRKFWGAVGDFGQARRMFEHARRRCCCFSNRFFVWGCRRPDAFLDPRWLGGREPVCLGHWSHSHDEPDNSWKI